MSKWELTKNEVIVFEDDEGNRYFDSLDIIVDKLNNYEEQLVEFKAENEELKNNVELLKRGCAKAVTKRELEVLKQNQELQQQLKEKDDEHELLINDFERETEKLRKQIKFESDARKRAIEALKTNTHQVCEKIRECVNNRPYSRDMNNQALKLRDDIIKLIDQIEKGEDNAKN